MHSKRSKFIGLVVGTATIGVAIFALIPSSVAPVVGLSVEEVREIRKVASEQTLLDPWTLLRGCGLRELPGAIYGSFSEVPHALRVNSRIQIGRVTLIEDGSVRVLVLRDKRPYGTHLLEKRQGHWYYFGTDNYETVPTPKANNLPETNHRPASPLAAGQQFRRAGHAQACAFGGGRSVNRWAK